MAYRALKECKYFCWDVSKIILEYTQDTVKGDNKIIMNELRNNFFVSEEKNMSIPSSYIRVYTFLLEIENYIRHNQKPDKFIILLNNKNTLDTVINWITSNYSYVIPKYSKGSSTILVPYNHFANDNICVIVILDEDWYLS